MKTEHNSSGSITVCCWILSTCHNSITQLYHLRHLDNCLCVITLIRQQNQKVENVRNQQIGVAEQNETENAYFLLRKQKKS